MVSSLFGLKDLTPLMANFSIDAIVIRAQINIFKSNRRVRFQMEMVLCITLVTKQQELHRISFHFEISGCSNFFSGKTN
jgi:hypothetical protein